MVSSTFRRCDDHIEGGGVNNFPVTCGFNHATIGFSGGECPVCKAEDALEDSQKKNRRISFLEERVALLEELGNDMLRDLEVVDDGNGFESMDAWTTFVKKTKPQKRPR
jgi:CRISPR/Cas system-associated protein Cas10 (large subunit of type III CRISPR-Cas system)